MLLELFGLASYAARGGDDPELFVRLNDPNKINALANDPRYNNRILSRLTARHKKSRELITRFFLADLDDDARWDLVESYFLGEDEEVDVMLDAAFEGAEPDAEKKEARKPASQSTGAFEVELVTTDCNMEEMPFSKIWDYAKDDVDDAGEKKCFDSLAELTAEGKFEKPIYAPELVMPSTEVRLTPVFAWPKSKVMLFFEEDAGQYAVARESKWQCFMTGSAFDPESLANAIRQ